MTLLFLVSLLLLTSNVLGKTHVTDTVGDASRRGVTADGGGEDKPGPTLMFLSSQAVQPNGAPWTRSTSAKLASDIQTTLQSLQLPAKVLSISDSRLLVTVEHLEHERATEVKDLLLKQPSIIEVEWERQKYARPRQAATPWRPPPPARGGPAHRWRETEKQDVDL